ncbi:hypothetical protein [Malikia spinosa]|uniref:hypothetical protein n=1 Tax=Malikia spinosa TaxID=86180 RepID=UPI0011B0BD8B|nr:hypothetical protein [Malikia spinosa]
MAVKFNLESSDLENIGIMASVPHGSSAEINMIDVKIRGMEKGLEERDENPGKILATLLGELGIQDDQEKLKAFQDLVSSLKETPTQSKEALKEKVKESAIFRLLGKAEPMLGILSSAVALGIDLISI